MPCSGGRGLTRDQPGGQIAHVHLALRLAGGRHRRQRLLLQHQLPRAQLLLLHLPCDCTRRRSERHQQSEREQPSDAAGQGSWRTQQRHVHCPPPEGWRHRDPRWGATTPPLLTLSRVGGLVGRTQLGKGVVEIDCGIDLPARSPAVAVAALCGARVQAQARLDFRKEAPVPARLKTSWVHKCICTTGMAFGQLLASLAQLVQKAFKKVAHRGWSAGGSGRESGSGSAGAGHVHGRENGCDAAVRDPCPAHGRGCVTCKAETA